MARSPTFALLPINFRRSRVAIGSVVRAGIIFSAFLFSVSGRAERLDPAWPTPNTAYTERRPIQEFVQPTASGEPESGLFGCHRSGGGQFHEGVDLKPIHRDRYGEPTDTIFAALPGVVRHINRNPGDSNYGRYIVIEHTAANLPALTLYAHLSSIAPGLNIGDSVTRAQVIAIMGRSSSGNAIPRDRAHLHFEMDVMLTRNFETWYQWKKFGSRNDHAIWNGMNLVGFDPLAFFDALRSGKVDSFTQYLSHLTPAVKVRIATKYIPDFIERYPTLLTKKLSDVGQLAGWEVTFDETGLPFAWQPLGSMEIAGLTENDPQAQLVDENLKLPRCKSLVFRKRGRFAIGRDLEANLQLLFGLRKQL